jgi:hypothetical protein
LNQNAFGGAADIGEGDGLHADLPDGESLEAGDGSADLAHTATEREAAFLRSFRAAVRGSKRDSEGGDPGTQDEQAQEGRVLATAQQPLWTGLPSPADAAAGADTRSPSTEAMVASVTEAIDRAIRAEMAPREGVPLDLRIDLAGENLGLTGIRITVTRTTLDVVLERTDSALGDQLVRAAEALAQRLMTRFSKRTVRVLDIASAREQADHESPATAASPPLGLFL